MNAPRLFIIIATLCLWPMNVTADAGEGRFPGAQWTKLTNPEELGWSSAHLAEARAFSESIGTTAVMIVQHSVIVDEWGDVAIKSPAHSVRKSLLSALIGIAVDENRIDLSNTLANLGINDNEPSLTEIEKQATVGDLIKARSGIYHAALYETKRMTASKPPRGSHAPGTFWHYNNWDFNALGTIYRQETGEDIFTAFERRIAKPLQMQDYVPGDGEYISGWQSEHSAYPFRISARDLARFGLLFLRKGRWNGRQIVPRSWVAESTRSHSDAGGDRGYGYMWWTGPGRFRSLGLKEAIFYAAGYRRQYAYVFPGRDLVIVHRINTDTSRAFPPWRQMERLLWHIFAAAGETTIGPSRAIEDASGVRLTGEALSEQLPGATLSGTHRKSGNPFRVTLMESGTLSAIAGANGQFEDNGDWRIDGDRYCQEYDKWIGGREFCYNVVRDGDLFKLFDRTGTFVNVLSVTYD